MNESILADQRRVDISGCRFGRLTALKRIGSNKKRQAIYQCICDCGEFVDIRADLLQLGNNKSCGCLQRIGRFMAREASIASYKRASVLLAKEYVDG